MPIPLILQGKMDAAANMIEKAILANPTYAEAFNNLGLISSLLSLRDSLRETTAWKLYYS